MNKLNDNVDSASSRSILEKIRRNREERDSLLRECLTSAGLGDLAADRLILKGIPQSQLFMAEIIPVIHQYYLALPELATKTILDVGPQNFAGTALLASIHSKFSTNRLKLTVTALDIESRLVGMKEVFAPEVEFLCENIYNLSGRSFDAVIASHVIEHVQDPIGFARALQRAARDFVIVAAPWQEELPLTRSHINIIDEDFVRAVGGVDLKVFVNYCWGKNRQVCIFRLDGAAKV